MAYLNTLAVAPSGLWEKIIFAFNGAIGNYALAIIVLTLCIKLVMLPLDYINRRSSAKMTEVQAKLQPKMAEIQKKYPDKTIQNQKLGELYQKEGFNPLGACLPMLIVMILSMVIFFTLFSGLNKMSSYKITQQYEQLQTAYITDYVKNEQGLSTDQQTEEYILTLNNEQITTYIITISQSADENVISVANANVKEKYSQVKESFLWIKNVWIADSPFARAIPSFESYASTAGLKLEDEEKEQAKTAYDAVMGQLEQSQGVNGYFILAILAGATTFLSQYLSTRTKKKKEKENYYTRQASQNANAQPQQQSGKAMMIIFPIIMLFFTLSYNAVFALYIITSQLFAMATAPLIGKLLTIGKNKDKKQK